MDLILKNMPLFLQGLERTFLLATMTLLLSTVISVVIGVFSVTRFRLLRAVALAYVEFFRGVPLIVNVLFVYFGAPLVGLSLGPFHAAIVSFTLWGSANGAEIVRGGLNSVSKHQIASAMALGLKPWEILWFIVGPQALLPILPPFTGLFTLLVQATSLGAIVGLTEFFRTGQIVVERETILTGDNPAYLIYGFVLFTYMAICSVLTSFTRRLELRIAQRRGRDVRRGPTPALPETRPVESV
ncbi:MAG: amino acid ABC transporter permease [Rhodospirillales bacterium]|nr:amino acid ABC transporter permease [Rhodospirillales bacterium]